MAVIDEKGRIFGKVNLLDLVVVLAVAAVASRFGYSKWVGRNAVPEGESKTIEVTLKFAGVAQPTVDELFNGVRLQESKTNALLGDVVETRTEVTPTMTVTDDGRIQINKDRFDHYVVIRGDGRISPNTITLNGFEMKIGRLNYVKNQRWAGGGFTWNIDLDPKPR